MTKEEAHTILQKNCVLEVGKFFGAVNGTGLGAGLIYQSVRTPILDLDENLFMTVENTAYVLTHECDVDQDNKRAFNDHVTICPLIPVAEFIQEYDGVDLPAFLAAIAQRKVSRVIYIPPGPDNLEFGAFAYLNQLTSTHISVFENRAPLTAVSAYGLQSFDYAIQNHWLRPKADRLSFSPRD